MGGREVLHIHSFSTVIVIAVWEMLCTVAIHWLYAMIGHIMCSFSHARDIGAYLKEMGAYKSYAHILLIRNIE
jgi:hypothetical protein